MKSDYNDKLLILRNKYSSAKETPVPDSVSPERMMKLLPKAPAVNPSSGLGITLTRLATPVFCVLLLVVYMLSGNFFGKGSFGALVSSKSTDKMGVSEQETTSQTTKYQTSGKVNPFLAKNPGDIFNALSEILETYKAQDVFFGEDEDRADTAPNKSGAAKATAENTSAAYGKTNNQVSGVEEADILQNDGKHLFYLNLSNDCKIQILNPHTDGKISLISEIPLSTKGAYPREMFLYKNKLAVVFSSSGGNTCGVQDVIYSSKDDSASVLRLYDISNLKSPRLDREISQNGSYISARLVDQYLYFVTNYYLSALEDVTKENSEGYLPKVKDSANPSFSLSYKDVSVLPAAKSANFIVVSGLNLESDAKPSVHTVLGAGDTVYATPEKLFLAENTVEEAKGYSPKTNLYSFGISKGLVSFEATGSVKGSLNNQFSMDYHEGYLRVAITSDDGAAENCVYILDAELKKVGSVTGLAKGERIKSVRFMGDFVYVVTFKDVDPLFVIDLKNPKSPKVISELKLPGFSVYLHPISEGYLVGVGSDGNNKGAYGTKLSLFDVRDPKNPKEIHKASLGNIKTSLTEGDNHKAITFVENRNLICVPLRSYGRNTSSEIAVYEVSLSKGFTFKARATGEIPVSGRENKYQAYYHYTTLTRSTYIENILYFFSMQSVISMDMDRFKKLNSLELYDPSLRESDMGDSILTHEEGIIAPDSKN